MFLIFPVRLKSFKFSKPFVFSNFPFSISLSFRFFVPRSLIFPASISALPIFHFPGLSFLRPSFPNFPAFDSSISHFLGLSNLPIFLLSLISQILIPRFPRLSSQRNKSLEFFQSRWILYVKRQEAKLDVSWLVNYRSFLSNERS